MSETLEMLETDASISQEGVWADVAIDVTLESYAKQRDRVVGIVTITARNNRSKQLRLTEPYSLPTRNAYTSKAVTGARDQFHLQTAEQLSTIETKKTVNVYFGDGKRSVPEGEAFTWTIQYCRMAELYLDGILAYDLYIDPQPKFQGADVKKHHFTLAVTLRTPDDSRWRPLKRWRLHQKNTPLDLNPTVTHSTDSTIYDFGEFDLIDQTFDLRIAAVYGFTSWIAHAFQLAVAATIVVLIEHGPALFLKFIEAVK